MDNVCLRFYFKNNFKHASFNVYSKPKQIMIGIIIIIIICVVLCSYYFLVEEKVYKF